ncbi:MAG TPA: hypothetical protein VK255_03285 [Patescibacteria group bacterium]|nr:hypothetical protein [Patescibacteria group bacterium]
MEQKDISNFNESTGKKKIAAGIVTGVIIGLIIVATGFYLWTKVAPEISTSKSQQSGQKGNQFGPEGNQIPPANPQNQIPGQAGETNEANEIIGDAGENVSVCEDGWQALTNNDVGYRL